MSKPTRKIVHRCGIKPRKLKSWRWISFRLAEIRSGTCVLMQITTLVLC